MINFPTQIPDRDTRGPSDLHLFLLILVCSAVVFHPLENSYHVVVSFSIDFPSTSKVNVPFHRTAFDYSLVDWDLLRDDPWDIFNLGASAAAAAAEFCKWVQAGIDVDIPHA